MDRLLQNAAQHLAFGNLRQAARPAIRAVNSAYWELDPVGVERAYRALAEIYLRVADLAADQEDIHSAAVCLAASGARKEVGREPSPLDYFDRVFRREASAETLERVVKSLTTPKVDPARRVGALRVLEAVVDLIPEELAPQVVDFALGSLRRGWHLQKIVNEAEPASKILVQLREQVTPSQVKQIRDTLLQLIDASPASARGDLFETFASFVVLPPRNEGGAVLVRRFIEELSSFKDHHPDRESVLVAIAAVVDRSDDVTPEHLRRAMDEAGLTGHLRIFWRLQGGQEVQQEEVDSAVRGLGETIRRHLAEAQTARSWGGGTGYSSTYYRVLSERADASICEEVLPDVLQLLGEDRHLYMTRRSYLSFAAYLALRSGAKRDLACEVFFRIARNGFALTHDMDLASRHPFSVFKLAGGSTEEDRAQALSCLALIHDGSTGETRNAIEEELSRASTDPNAAVRAAAIRQIGYLLESADDPALPQLPALRSQILVGLQDPTTQVRVAALGAVQAACNDLDSEDSARVLGLVREYADNEAAPAAAAKVARQALARMRERETTTGT